jgi:putative phosphoesterase
VEEPRIGVISDTHGLRPPEALEALRGVHHILHAGDIGAPGILEALERIAPVSAIRGNIDRADWARAHPETRTVEIEGLSVHLVHDVRMLDPAVVARGVDVVVSGHSHRSGIATRGGTLFLNPGSAGPRRFRLPVTLATLSVTDGRPSARIVTLLD